MSRKLINGNITDEVEIKNMMRENYFDLTFTDSNPPQLQHSSVLSVGDAMFVCDRDEDIQGTPVLGTNYIKVEEENQELVLSWCIGILQWDENEQCYFVDGVKVIGETIYNGTIFSKVKTLGRKIERIDNVLYASVLIKRRFYNITSDGVEYKGEWYFTAEKTSAGPQEVVVLKTRNFVDYEIDYTVSGVSGVSSTNGFMVGVHNEKLFYYVEDYFSSSDRPFHLWYKDDTGHHSANVDGFAYADSVAYLNGTYFVMDGYHVYSSTDLDTWAASVTTSGTLYVKSLFTFNNKVFYTTLNTSDYVSKLHYSTDLSTFIEIYSKDYASYRAFEKYIHDDVLYLYTAEDIATSIDGLTFTPTTFTYFSGYGGFFIYKNIYFLNGQISFDMGETWTPYDIEIIGVDENYAYFFIDQTIGADYEGYLYRTSDLENLEVITGLMRIGNQYKTVNADDKWVFIVNSTVSVVSKDYTA